MRSEVAPSSIVNDERFRATARLNMNTTAAIGERLIMSQFPEHLKVAREKKTIPAVFAGDVVSQTDPPITLDKEAFCSIMDRSIPKQVHAEISYVESPLGVALCHIANELSVLL